VQENMFLKLGQRQLSCTERCLNRVGACKGNATCWCMHSNLFEVITHPYFISCLECFFHPSLLNPSPFPYGTKTKFRLFVLFALIMPIMSTVCKT
jgi:hypothetical protein